MAARASILKFADCPTGMVRAGRDSIIFSGTFGADLAGALDNWQRRGSAGFGLGGGFCCFFLLNGRPRLT